MPGMAGNRTKKRRREEQPSALDLLLDDPAALHAANEAFALAEWPDAEAWPFVASVGLETVALRWTGESSIPLPITPWRAGYDARVWVADRADLAGSNAVATSGRRGSAVLVGWFEETLVCVNTARAPGPVAVSGEDEEAGLLRELISFQARIPARMPQAGPGPRWPIEVGGGVIQLLGLAVARTFAEDEARRAGELVRLVAALELVRRNEVDAARAAGAAGPGMRPGPMPSPRPMPPRPGTAPRPALGPGPRMGALPGPGPSPTSGQGQGQGQGPSHGPGQGHGLGPGQAQGPNPGQGPVAREPEPRVENPIEVWLNQVKAAAAQVAVSAHQHQPTAAEKPAKANADAVDVDAAGDPGPVTSSSAIRPVAPGKPRTATSGIDDLDDWTSSFAVSSND